MERGCRLTGKAALGQESAFVHRNQMDRIGCKRSLAGRHPRQINEAERLKAMIMIMIGYVQNRIVASCEVVVVER